MKDETLRRVRRLFSEAEPMAEKSIEGAHLPDDLAEAESLFRAADEGVQQTILGHAANCRPCAETIAQFPPKLFK